MPNNGTAYFFRKTYRYQKAKKEALFIAGSIKLPYHGMQHPLRVERIAMEIAKKEKVGMQEMELLSLAALFHDTGYGVVYKDNEPEGARIAGSKMNEAGYSSKDIELVKDMIVYGTRFPQHPRTRLQEILADADVSGFGTSAFWKFREQVRKEAKIREGLQWLLLNQKMLELHHFFTKTGKRMFAEGQKKNTAILKQKIKQLKKGVSH